MTLVFLHLPKAGGRTLLSVLRRQYDPQAIHEVYSHPPAIAIENLLKLPPAERSKIRLIAGHVAFGIHEELVGPLTYLTMLRDPVERVLSTYHYAKSRTSHPKHLTVTQMDFLEVLDSGLFPLMNNGQCRMLSGAEFQAGIPYGDNPPDLYERAMRNLQEHFPVVGITERFDESLLLMKRAFHWKDVTYRRRNVGVGRPREIELPAEPLRRIRELNVLDQMLYGEMLDRLLADVARAGLGFRAELLAFRARNGPLVSRLKKELKRCIRR